MFKQKTPYERRISDWSSDVCSSYLPLLPMGQALFGANDNPVHDEPQNPDRDETDKNRRQIVVKLSLLHAKAKAGLRSNELSRNNGCPGRTEANAKPDQDKGRRRRYDHAKKDHPVICAQNPSRIEIGRHTSELQSLMPISSAVFCLKKKT